MDPRYHRVWTLVSLLFEVRHSRLINCFSLTAVIHSFCAPGIKWTEAVSTSVRHMHREIYWLLPVEKFYFFATAFLVTIAWFWAKNGIYCPWKILCILSLPWCSSLFWLFEVLTATPEGIFWSRTWINPFIENKRKLTWWGKQSLASERNCASTVATGASHGYSDSYVPALLVVK